VSSRIVCVSLVIVFACMASFQRLSAQAPDAQGAAGAGDQRFAGKAIFLRAKADPKGTLLLEQASVQTFGTETFLTGIPADMGDNAWSKGVRHWIPLDNVLIMMEFDGKDDYLRRAKTAHPRPAAQPKPDPAPQSKPRNPGDL
jgi:hypothetical protein